MKTLSTTFALLAALTASSGVQALQPSDRTNNWEATFIISDVQGDTYAGYNGSSAKTLGDEGFGFGIGYNVDENLSFTGYINWADLKYDAVIKREDGNDEFINMGTLDIRTFGFNGTYNLLRKSFTPFVTGGVGFTYYDTNIVNSPPYTTCWYDPWYGYFCDTVVPTKDGTDFSYNVGAGLRWDVNDKFFMKLAANQMWLDSDGQVDSPEFLSYTLELGTKFY